MKNFILIEKTILFAICIYLPVASRAQAGSLDLSLGDSGIVTTNIIRISEISGGHATAIQSDGKIVVAGYHEGTNCNPNNSFSSDNDILLVRYNANGSLDATFGNTGIVSTDFGGNDAANAIAIQSDGKIVVSGTGNNRGGGAFSGTSGLIRYNTNGSLDTTFGTGGIVTTSIGNYSIVSSIAIQSDGKIVLGGYSAKDAVWVFTITRYTTNGSIDNTFGSGGVVTMAISTSSILSSLAIQSDGKIIAVGTIYTTMSQSMPKMCLVRFTTNGSLDNSFGIVTTTNAGKKTCLDDRGNATAIQSDGKIVVAGRSDQKYALIRYNTNGSLDATFGIGGIVATDIWYSINSIAIQSDGKILVAGQGSQGLIRFNSNGSFDATFGNGGTAIISGDAVANAVTIQNDGKIIVACESQGGTYISLLRFTANGTLDSSFGFNGIATKSGLGGRALAIQSDGKIAVAGFSKNSSPYGYDFALVRYNTNGSLDSTFGTGGIVSTAIGDFAIAEAIAIQSDGKILLAGWTIADGGFVLARYNTNGSLDNTFGNNGIVNTNISDVEKVNSLVIQSDGKIIAGGYSISGSDFALNLSVVRYKTNGSLDSTFGNAGIVATPVGNHNTDLYSIKCALALQTDGKIIIAGVSAFNNNYDFALVRYHNDNTLGINEIGNKNTEINIFPNPTTGNIYLSVNANIVLTDLLGKLLLEQKNTKHLDISALPAGMYFLRYGDNLKQTFKVIKE